MSHSLHYRITWETIVILIATSLCSAASLGCSVNPALSTFAAERRAAAPCYRSPVACDRVVSKLLLHCCNGTNRQTDGRTDTVHRLRCVYYAGSENNYVLSYYSSLQKSIEDGCKYHKLCSEFLVSYIRHSGTLLFYSYRLSFVVKKSFLKLLPGRKPLKHFPLEPAKLGLILENFDFFSRYMRGRLSHRDVDGGDVLGAICCTPDGQ